VTEHLTDADRALLRRITKILVPDAAPGAPIPLPPALALRVRSVLADLAGAADLTAALGALVASASTDAHALLLVVSATHYADPEVRDAIGYPGPQPIPLPPLPDPDDAELDALLERVRERGPIYRDA
jgi:hypothetical protein